MWVCDTSFAYKKYGFKTRFNLNYGLLDYKKRLEINEFPLKYKAAVLVKK